MNPEQLPEAWQPLARPSGPPVRLPKLARSVSEQRTHWGLIVVHKGYVYHDRNQLEKHPWRYHPRKFAQYLVEGALGDCLIVGTHIASTIADVVEHWKAYPHFEMSASPIRQPDNGKDWSFMPIEWLQKYRPEALVDGKHKALTIEQIKEHGFHIKFIGWKNKGHGPYVRRHYPIDPYNFATSLRKTFNQATLEDMVAWATDLQTWFNDERPDTMKYPAPANHKVAAGLLRAYFDKGPRHSLNERIRSSLPGNVYVAFADPRVCYPTALEIDQSAAHHHSAAEIEFPSRSGLRVFGHADDVAERRGWKDFDSVLEMIDKEAFKGLLLVKGWSRINPRSQVEQLRTPPWFERGEHIAWVFTNEIDYLLESGIHPNEVIAAWLSPNVDDHPNQYARWALEQIAEATPDRKDWLKPMLLATYGMLAARPFTWQEARLRGSGKEYDFHAGRGKRINMNYKSIGEWHGSYVNIMHRGMIEAETRKRSLRMARHFLETQHKLLAVYADGIYIAPADQLPIVEPGWKVTPITNAYFPLKGQVICDQYAKLPGFSGSARKAYLTLYGKVKDAPYDTNASKRRLSPGTK